MSLVFEVLRYCAVLPFLCVCVVQRAQRTGFWDPIEGMEAYL